MPENFFERLRSRFPADSQADCFILEGGQAVNYGTLDLTSARIARLLVRRGIGLAGFKVPKVVYRIAALPRNSMGKVQKNLVRQNYAEIAADSLIPSSVAIGKDQRT